MNIHQSVFLLQSGDWIEVQVQDMKPKLTEVGKTLEEAERYQQEHEEMVRKIAVSRKSSELL